jgi:hypothetical protein
VQKVRDEETGEIKKIYNFGVGTYDVVATAGPSFATKRQEAVEAMTTMSQGNPAVFPVIGDLMVKAMDWPGAEEMAKRLKAMVPPQALAASEADDDEKPAIPPQVEQAMEAASQMIQQLQQVVGQSQQELEAMKQDKQLEAGKLSVDQFNAETNRMKAEADIALRMQEAQKQEAETQAQEMAEPEPNVVDVLAAPINSLAQGIGAALQQQGEALTMLAQSQALMQQILAAPKKVVRGPDNEIVGVVVVGPEPEMGSEEGPELESEPQEYYSDSPEVE